jgi:hypothetical protein
LGATGQYCLQLSPLDRTQAATGWPRTAFPGGAVRDNREKALLSHCFTKAMVQGWVDANPCRGVHRNSERPRERMIERRLQKRKRLAFLDL